MQLFGHPMKPIFNTLAALLTVATGVLAADTASGDFVAGRSSPISMVIPVYPGAAMAEVDEYPKVRGDTFQRVRTLTFFTASDYADVEQYYRRVLADWTWVDLGQPRGYELHRRLGAMSLGDRLDALLAPDRLLDGPLVIVSNLAASKQHLDPLLDDARTGIRIDLPQNEPLIEADDVAIAHASKRCRPSDEELKESADAQDKLPPHKRELTYPLVKAGYCNAFAQACRRDPSSLRCQHFLRHPRRMMDL